MMDYEVYRFLFLLVKVGVLKEVETRFGLSHESPKGLTRSHANPKTYDSGR